MKLSSVTSSNGFSQLINEPTHIQTNSISCINLIFTDQENLCVNSGVHSSLHPYCHHQIIYSSFNLNVYYSPPYQRLVWDYEKANSTTIRKALDSVYWERLFNGKYINAQVTSFNETILNVFKNYVPNKHITIDDRDPVWMNDTIKAKIKTKNLLFKEYVKNKRFENDFDFLKALITDLNKLISSTKLCIMKTLQRN